MRIAAARMNFERTCDDSFALMHLRRRPFQKDGDSIGFASAPVLARGGPAGPVPSTGNIIAKNRDSRQGVRLQK